jgi:hypothetical protein
MHGEQLSSLVVFHSLFSPQLSSPNLLPSPLPPDPHHTHR